MKLILGRMLHIFSLENQDGVCSSWVFITHTFCHGVAVMTPPLVLMIVVVSDLLDVLKAETVCTLHKLCTGTGCWLFCDDFRSVCTIFVVRYCNDCQTVTGMQW